VIVPVRGGWGLTGGVRAWGGAGAGAAALVVVAAAEATFENAMTAQIKESSFKSMAKEEFGGEDGDEGIKSGRASIEVE